MLHFYVLWGGDRFVNLIEWLSFVGCIVGGVSLIAEQLGAAGYGPLLAAVLFATIPEAILEASGAMNTCVASFWIVVTVYFALRWKDEPVWANTFALGSAIGLAILTKGTALAFLPPLLAVCW
jgi:4-amino-4-deoxy-L-arabinose transferase-like glycosyltransferase